MYLLSSRTNADGLITVRRDNAPVGDMAHGRCLLQETAAELSSTDRDFACSCCTNKLHTNPSCFRPTLALIHALLAYLVAHDLDADTPFAALPLEARTQIRREVVRRA